MGVAAPVLVSLVKFPKNVTHRAGSPEDVGDVLEKEVAQESPVHHLLRLDAPWYGEHLASVDFYHPSLFVLGNDGEEVEQPPDVLLTTGGSAAAGRGLRPQVVGKIVEDNQCAGRVEVEHIGVLLAVALAVAGDVARVLCAKGGLHIERRAFHVAQHEHAAPLGNGDARGELSHAQGDGPGVAGNGRLHPVICLCRFAIVVQPAVAGRHHHLVVGKRRPFLLKEAGQGLGALHAVEQPERVR